MCTILFVTEHKARRLIDKDDDDDDDDDDVKV